MPDSELMTSTSLTLADAPAAPDAPTLRPYQQQAVEAVSAQFRAPNRHRRVLLQAPTGAGKTVIFCHLVAKIVAAGQRVALLTHRIEIARQISGALTLAGVPHGWIAAGVRPTPDAQVVVCMVQTLANRLQKAETAGTILMDPPHFAVQDEAHHAVSATWRSIGRYWPSTRILGTTATPERLDGRGLHTEFDVLVCGPNPRELIEAGHLAKPRYLAPESRVDLDGMTMVAGDYAQDELAEAVDTDEIAADVIDTYRQHLDGKPVLVFTVNVAHAAHVAEAFRDAGYRAESVDGTTDAQVRQDRLAAIGDGRLDVLTSCMLMSEGVDVPGVQGVILLRPTASLALHLQMLGRCLRPKADGSGAVVLDHVGNLLRLGFAETDRVWTLEDRPKKARDAKAKTGIKVCPACSQAFETKPGWRAANTCALDHPGCVLKEPEAELPSLTGSGTLVEYSDTPSWAAGLSITGARGEDRAKLLTLANTPDREERKRRLKAIADFKGYQRGWVFLQERDLAAAAARAAPGVVPGGWNSTAVIDFAAYTAARTSATAILSTRPALRLVVDDEMRAAG